MKFSVGSMEKPRILSTYWKRNQEHCQPVPEINTKIINRWPGKIANWVNRSPEKTWIRPICRGEKLAKSIDRSRENITNFGSWLRCCQSFQIRKFFGKWKKKIGVEFPTSEILLIWISTFSERISTSRPKTDSWFCNLYKSNEYSRKNVADVWKMSFQKWIKQIWKPYGLSTIKKECEW